MNLLGFIKWCNIDANFSGMCAKPHLVVDYAIWFQLFSEQLHRGAHVVGTSM